MEWFFMALKHYADFSGRARRMEYWMFYLLNIIITIVFEISYFVTMSDIFRILLGLIGVAVLIPSLAVIVRRLHDQDKSGGWFFIIFIPFLVGPIWFLVLMCTPGTIGSNRYGDDPMAPEEPQEPAAAM